MIPIDNPAVLNCILAAPFNPWLKRWLMLHRDQLAEAGCDIGELGPVLIIEPGDAIDTIEQAAGLPITTNFVDGATFPDREFEPSWETCQFNEGWHEIVYVTCDDGSGAVLLVPDRDDIDSTLLAIIRTFGAGGNGSPDPAVDVQA